MILQWNHRAHNKVIEVDRKIDIWKHACFASDSEGQDTNNLLGETSLSLLAPEPWLLVSSCSRGLRLDFVCWT